MRMLKGLWVTAMFALSIGAPSPGGPPPPREDAVQPPSAVIGNARMRIRLLLPDDERGYYQGVRFNRGGVIDTVTVGDHIFFGAWRDDQQRGQNDAIMGPADEFDMEDPPGYDAAAADGTFVKIGVGVLRRVDERPYRFWHGYPLVDPGDWSVDVREDRAVFTHRLRGPGGIAYVLTKTILAEPEAPEFTITYRLQNTGERPLRTVQYHHNFCVFDGVDEVGPDLAVTFGHAPLLVEPEVPVGFTLTGRAFRFTERLGDEGSVKAAFRGTEDARAHRIRVDHRPSGRGIVMSGSEPLARLELWAARRAVCPEPFVAIEVAPGETRTWWAGYRFVTPD